MTEERLEKLAKIFGGILLVLVVFFAIFTCTYVEPGSVGIKVNLYGVDRGVDTDYPIDTGYVWYCRWTTKVYEYPTFIQRAVFTADNVPESPMDESISFNSKEGIQVRADVGLHYQIPKEMASKVFVRIRGDETAVREYLKSKMRDAVNHTSSDMSINEIYGEGKNELLAKSKEFLESTLKDEIKIEMLTFVNAMQLPPEVQQSINMTIQAKQAAIAAENKIVQSKAEADQKIEEARGRGESILLEAQKQAEANTTLSKSLTPELINWNALQKWDGKLPQVSSGAVPFINLNK